MLKSDMFNQGRYGYISNMDSLSTQSNSYSFINNTDQQEQQDQYEYFFSVIHKIMQNNRICALKIQRNISIDAEREAAVMNRLQYISSPYVIQIFKAESHQIITEFCERGDLVSLIESARNQFKYLSENTIRVMMSMILRSYLEIQKLGLAHNDVKLDNILMTKDYRLKLADFGFTKQISEDCIDTSSTRSQAAPEVHSGSKFDNGLSDVYSIGETMHLLAQRCWSNVNCKFSSGNWNQNDQDILFSMFKTNLQKGKRLTDMDGFGIVILSKLLHPNPLQRLPLQVLLGIDKIVDEEFSYKLHEQFWMNEDQEIPQNSWCKYVIEMQNF